MAELISKKQVNKWTDGLLIGLSKVTTEKLLEPFIGNSSLTSGIIKMGAGSIVSNMKGKIAYTVGAGMQADGVEDLAIVLINKTNGLFGLLGGSSNTEAAAPKGRVI